MSPAHKMRLSNDGVDIKSATPATTSQCVLSSLTEDCLSHVVSFMDCVDLYFLEDTFFVIDKGQHQQATMATTGIVSQKKFVTVLRRVTRMQWDALHEMDSNNNSINRHDESVPNQD